MKKNIIKPIVMSALSALAFGAVGTAGTFALFTDKTETSVQVQAGKVDVESSLSDLAFYELGVTSPISTETTDGAKINSIGGTAKIVGSSLVLNKWAPGDKVTFKLTTKNKSNVEILTKLRVNHTSTSAVDLFEALNISYEWESGIAQSELFHWSKVHASSNMDTGDTISVINVTIEFPNRSNEITARNEGIDNHFQESNCTIVFTQQAVQGNASTVDLVSKWNNILGSSTSPNKNDSLTAALNEIEDATEALLKSERIVWNAEDDQFCYEEEVPLGQEYKYFKAYDNMPFIQNWSVYASNDWTGGDTVNLKGIGFDAGGAASSIKIVSYVGEAAARINRIYTNSASTNITINAPLDTVNHYGVAGTLDIVAVAGSSYHEFGKIAFASIAKGRIALESTSKVSQIHVEKKTESTFDDIIIAKASTVDLPTLSRDDVDIPSGTGTLVVALQEGTGTVQQNELDYVWLTKQGVYEQVAISDNKGSAVSAATSSTVYADQVNDEETKTAAQQIANNIEKQVVIDNKTYDVSVDSSTREIVLTNANDNTDVASADTVTANLDDIVVEKGLNETKKNAAVQEQVAIVAIEENANYVARVGTTGYATLQAAVDAANANDTVYLLKDIALADEWIKIDKSLFIEGDGHTVTATNSAVAVNKKFYVFYFEDAAGAELIDGAIRNLTINCTGYQVAILVNDNDCEIANPNKLLIENLTVFTQGGAVYSNGRSVATVKNSTFNRSGIYEAGKAQPYYAAGQVGYGGTLDLEGVTINSDHTGVASYPSGGTINVRNSTITMGQNSVYAAYAWHQQNYYDTNSSILAWGAAATINIYSGNINGVLAENLETHTAGSALNRGAEINLYGGTYDRDVADYCASGYRAKKLSETSWQVVEMCQNHQFGAATEIDEIHHKRVCTVCGYEEISLHEYEDACGECTVCHHGGESDTAHAANKVSVSHGNVVEYYDEVHEFFEDFNNPNNTNNVAYTLTFGPGIYHLPVNTYLIEQNPSYQNRTLRITGTRANNEYLSVIMPVYGTHLTSEKEGTDSGLFCVSGMSDFNEGAGSFNVDNLFFDIPAHEPFNKSYRFFAIYCLNGGSGQPSTLFPDTEGTARRYAHNIMVEYCKFVGPGGKFANAVGSNRNNSQPSCITIQHCEGEKMNCWFNGYAIKAAEINNAFGVKVIDCESSEFLIVANVMSGGSSLYIDDVDGTFLYNDPTVDNGNTPLAPGATDSLDGTENWIAQVESAGEVTVLNCEWTMLSNTKNGSGTFINGKGAFDLTVSNSSFTKRLENTLSVSLSKNANNSSLNALVADPTIVIA